MSDGLRWTPEQVAEHMARIKGPEVKDNEPDIGPESELQGKINKWCREHGFPFHSFRQSRKAQGFITPGMPDMCIFINHGRTVHIELKSATGTLKSDQKKIRAILEWNGHKVHVIKSYKLFLSIMAGYLDHE